MPSVSSPKAHRAALIAACALLALGAATGCATTQETAQHKQAESKRILQARQEKQRQSNHGSQR